MPAVDVMTRFWKKLARGSTKKRRGKMNRLEALYAEHLTAQQLRGGMFEGLSFRFGVRLSAKWTNNQGCPFFPVDKSPPAGRITG